MKTMLKVLSLAAFLAATAPLAFADTINGSIGLTGPGTFTVASGVGTFKATPPDSNHSNHVTSDDGTFTDFDLASSTEITFDNFTTNEATPAEIFNITMASGEELIFTASGFSGLEGPGTSSAGSVNIAGIITIIHDGTTTYTPASGTLDFEANGKLLNFTESTLAAGGTSVTTTPEPGSLFLLGTGMLTVVGLGRRKFNV